MIDIEQLLRERKEFMPKVGLFDAEHDDIDGIGYVHLGLTAALKVEHKAEKAKIEFLDSFEGSNGDELAHIEYKNKLIYWAVIYGLSVDDEAAYKRNGIDYMENFIENFLGKEYRVVYEDLGLEILRESGLSHLLEVEEVDAEEETVPYNGSVAA